MKKILALVLMLAVVLASVPALAAAPTIDLLFAETPIDVPMEGSETVIDVIYGGSTYDIYYFWPDENGELQYDNSATDRNVGDEWYFKPLGSDWTQEKWETVGVQPWVAFVNGEFGKVAIEWYSTYIEKDGEPYVRLSVNPWEVDEDGNLREVVLADGEGFLDKNKDAMEDIMDQEDPEESKPQAYSAKWYPHNTVCVAGVEFRDVRPELTSKWYNFAAIDLSEDGVQVYDLVASNLYVIGSVTVTKTGDEVVVNWQLAKQGTTDANFQLEDEFLTIFSDLDAVTEVDPAKYEGPTYEFGQVISIANDLGGDTNVLLYICNQATYCNNLSYKYQNPIYHARYWPNLDEYVAAREAMMALVEADLAK